MDCSPPHSSVHGIFQARILEWVASPFSRGSSQSRDQTQVSHIAGGFFTIWATREALKIIKCESCSVLSDSLRPHGLYSPWNSPGQNTRMGRYSRLQGIFPSQGSNPGLLHYRWIFYHLSYQGSPILPLKVASSGKQYQISSRGQVHFSVTQNIMVTLAETDNK